MLSSYQYKILRYIRRKKSCTSAQLVRRFDPGVRAALRLMPEYVDSPFLKNPDGSYTCMQDDRYFLTDAGYAQLSEYRIDSRAKWLNRVVGFIAGILSAVLCHIFTEFLLPLILR